MPQITSRKTTPSSEAIAALARERMNALTAEGMRMAGNAFAQVVFVQGEPCDPDQPDCALAGRVGTALEASLDRLGYAPGAFACILAYAADGALLPPGLLRQAIAAFDPHTVVTIDDTAASTLREAYAAELSELDNLQAACLVQGAEAQVLGMRMVHLGNFAHDLNDDTAKQRAWAILKRLAPLGEPY